MSLCRCVRELAAQVIESVDLFIFARNIKLDKILFCVLLDGPSGKKDGLQSIRNF